MKKSLSIFAVFFIVFTLTYLAMTFCIPGWRIKLDAPSMEYFVESLKSMMLLKCSASLITGAVAALLLSYKYKK